MRKIFLLIFIIPLWNLNLFAQNDTIAKIENFSLNMIYIPQFGKFQNNELVKISSNAFGTGINIGLNNFVKLGVSVFYWNLNSKSILFDSLKYDYRNTSAYTTPGKGYSICYDCYRLNNINSFYLTLSSEFFFFTTSKLNIALEIRELVGFTIKNKEIIYNKYNEEILNKLEKKKNLILLHTGVGISFNYKITNKLFLTFSPTCNFLKFKLYSISFNPRVNYIIK